MSSPKLLRYKIPGKVTFAVDRNLNRVPVAKKAKRESSSDSGIESAVEKLELANDDDVKAAFVNALPKLLNKALSVERYKVYLYVLQSR